MLFKRKVTTVEAEQFLPKDGDTTFTLFGQECEIKFHKTFGVYCSFNLEAEEIELIVNQGEYLVKEDERYYTLDDWDFEQTFEPVKE